jgi:hypothetical protein
MSNPTIQRLHRLVMLPVLRRNPKASRTDLAAALRQAAREHEARTGETAAPEIVDLAITQALASRQSY